MSDIQIPNLPPATDLTGSEQLEIVQDGVSRRATITQIVTDAQVPLPATSLPRMDGGASVGAELTYARGDHIHPTDTTRLAVSGGEITGDLTVDGNLQVSGMAEFDDIIYVQNGAFIFGVDIEVGTIDDVSIGSTTPNTGKFTSLSASGTVSGAGFVALLAPYAPKDSPTFTGDPKAPTPLTADNDTSIATTAFVKAQGYAPSSSLGTMSTQNANAVAITGGAINGTTVGATTPSTGAFTTLSASGVVSGAGFTTLLSTYAKIDSQAFTGTPSLPTGTTGITQTALNNSTRLATTAYVDAASTALGLGTMATQNANAVAITGGTINNASIGATTRSTGAFTTLAANGAATFTSSLTASPASANVVLSPTGTGVVTIAPATLGTINNMSVGATTPSTGAFTTLVATSINSTPIGATTPSTGAFTTLSATSTATFTGALTASPANASVTLSPTGTGTVTINPATLGTINNMTIGATTAAAGTFTNLTATGTVSGAGFTTLLTPYALVNSQVFTGTPSLPTGTIGVTQAAATNNTTLATTAYVKSQNYLTANQTITLSGDVTGSGAAAIAATVVQLQGRPLSASLPATGNLMGWNGTTWGPVAAGAAAAGGTANQIQYNNGGVLGGIATTGTFAGSSVVMSIAPTLANSLTITSAAGGSSLTMSKFTGAFSNMILGRTNALNRWALGVGNNTAETGSANVGTDFTLDRYDDAGNFIDRPLSIYRTDGRANFSVTATFPAGFTAGSSTFTNACTIAPSGATSAILTLNKSSGSTGVIAAVEGQTVGSRRWLTIMGNGTTEGGSNAGSDFLINRYSDTAVFIDTPFQIIRSTGIATFSKAIVAAGETINAPAATDATLILNKPVATQNNILYGQKATLNRWAVIPGNSTAEGGSNAGSDFQINSYNDAGAFLATPFTLNRATAQANFSGAIVTTSGVVTLAPTVGDSVLYLNKSGSTKTSAIYGQTGASVRWIMQMGDNTAESGSNAGSNFSIARFNDAGVYQDTPFNIARSSGTINITQTGGGWMGINGTSGQWPQIILNKAAGGVGNVLTGSTNGVTRWQMGLGNQTAESAGSGSDFSLARYNDAGTFLDTPFFIARSTGAAVFANVVTATRHVASTPYAFQVTGVEVGTGPTSYTQYPAMCDPSYGAMNLYVQHVPGTSVKWAMSILSAGTFAFDGGGNGYAPASWISLSDLRVKTDIKEIGSALEKVGKLTGCTYERTDIHNLDGTRSMHAGLIAQDIQAVLPEAVFEDKTPDGKKMFGEEEPGPLSYAVNGVVALLVNAVKELTARVEALEAAAAPAPVKTRRSR